MLFDLNDADVRALLIEIADMADLRYLIDEYGDKHMVDQAIKWLECSDTPLPGDAEAALQQFLQDICPEHCNRCGCNIPMTEMADAITNGGYCGECAHRMARLDAE